MEEKVFITKYALTKGIQEAKANIIESCNDKNIKYSYVKFFYVTNLVLDKDAFIDKSEAIKKAEEMRLKKIESLKKQIKKLEDLKFE